MPILDDVCGEMRETPHHFHEGDRVRYKLAWVLYLIQTHLSYVDLEGCCKREGTIVEKDLEPEPGRVGVRWDDMSSAYSYDPDRLEPVTHEGREGT